MYVLMIDETHLNTRIVDSTKVGVFMLGRSIKEWVCYAPGYGIVLWPADPKISAIQNSVNSCVAIAEMYR